LTIYTAVTELQYRLATLLSIASAAANRLDQLRSLNAVDNETKALIDSLVGCLSASQEVGEACDDDLVGVSVLFVRNLAVTGCRAACNKALQPMGFRAICGNTSP
jgi:hypothetical protein